jgi:hypothetical protein
MSVTTTHGHVSYNGNGSTATFTVTFQFFDASDLVVTIVRADGVESVLTLTTHYSVTGGASGGVPGTGSITVAGAQVPVTGEKIIISRAMPLTQPTVHANNDGFPAKTVEGSYDRRALVGQDNRLLLNRAVKQTIGDYVANGSLVMPSPQDGRAVGWDSAGNLANLPLTGEAFEADLAAAVAAMNAAQTFAGDAEQSATEAAASDLSAEGHENAAAAYAAAAGSLVAAAIDPIDAHVGGAAPAGGLNAFQDRFGTVGQSVTSPWIYSNGVMTYAHNVTAATDIVDCNTVVRVERPRMVSGGEWITYTHFVDAKTLFEKIGLVPDDGTPPEVTIAAGLVKQAHYGSLGSNWRVFVFLRYGDTRPEEFDFTVRVATDVTFNGVTTDPETGYLGAGDTTTFAHTANQIHPSSDILRYYHAGIPVPATYDGKDFAGIGVSCWAFDEAAGINVMDVIPPVVILGDTPPDADDIVRSVVDDTLPPVSVADPGFSAMGSEDALRLVNARNCAKVLYLGDSLGQYTPSKKKKQLVPLVNGRTDHVMLNIAKSGFDAKEIAALILTDINDHDARECAKSLLASTAIISTFGNDTFAFGNRTRHYEENLRELIQIVKGLGARPVLAGEGQTDRVTAIMAMAQVADRMGIEYWPQHDDLFQCEPSDPAVGTATREADYWGDSGHPSVRPQHMMAHVLASYIATLPRPRSAVKLYRRRRKKYHVNPLIPVTPRTLLRFDGQSLVSEGSYTGTGVIAGSGAALSQHTDYGWGFYNNASAGRISISSGIGASYTKSCFRAPDNFTGVQHVCSGVTLSRHSLYFNGTSLLGRHGNTDYVSYTWPYPAGERHHISLSYDANTQVMTLKVDGVTVDSETSVPAHSGTDVIWGTTGAGTGSQMGWLWDCRLDDEALLDRYSKALSHHADSLIYDTPDERNEIWEPIVVGHRHGQTSQDPYYDQQSVIVSDHGGYTAVNAQCEYTSLMKGEALDFLDQCLVEFVVDATARGIRALEFSFDAPSDVKVKARVRQSPFSYAATSKQVGFAVATKPFVVFNDVYEDASGNDYRVVNVADNWKDRDADDRYAVWCVPLDTSATTDRTAGTLTKLSGSGVASFDHNGRYTGTSGLEEAQRYGPYGGWLELPVANGRVQMKGMPLLSCMNYDKIEFLLEKRGAFTVANPELRWYGQQGKDDYRRPRVEIPPGITQGNASPTFDTSATGYTLIGGAAAELSTALDDWKPHGLQSPAYVVRISKTKQIQTFVDISALTERNRTLVLQIMCRLWFAPFVASATEATAALEYDRSSWSYEDSSDLAKIGIDLISPSFGDWDAQKRYALRRTEYVGPGWVPLRVRYQIPSVPVWNLGSNDLRLDLYCDDDVAEIAVAKVEWWLN